MDVTDILAQMGGLKSVATELGISEAQATTGAAALIPAILGGFKKTAQAQPSGLDGLGGLLSQLGGAGLLDAVLSPAATDVSPGNSVLGQIFGSKDVSRTVAQNAAAQTGLSAELLKKMLPMIAMLVAGYMAKSHTGGNTTTTDAAPPHTDSGGGLGGLLGGLLGGVTGGSAGTTPIGGRLASMIDMNHDGNALDDIIRMAGKAMQK
jgi:hypothetical protein